MLLSATVGRIIEYITNWFIIGLMSTIPKYFLPPRALIAQQIQ
jgi:hypothetical protein